MRTFVAMAPVVIRTKDSESCATGGPEERCQFYRDYECELFHRGEILLAGGRSGQDIIVFRWSECRKLTGDE